MVILYPDNELIIEYKSLIEKITKKWRVRRNVDYIPKTVAIIYGVMYEVDRTKINTLYHHYKKHIYIPLVSTMYDMMVYGKYLAEGLDYLIIDFETGEAYDFKPSRPETGQGYEVWSDTFKGILAQYSPEYGVEIFKVLFINRWRKLPWASY